MIDYAMQVPFDGDAAPLLSVVLPVYNGGIYLAEAIESILAQTLQNFELIIIDDGSTDDSLAKLKQYQCSDSRIILISRKNKGLVTTLNESLNLARAPWIARMDQDDICMPHRFEKQLQWLELSGADICGSWIKYFDCVDRHACRYYETDEAIKIDMLFKSPFAHPTVVMRTELAKNLLYERKCEKAEDYDLWVRAAQAGWKMSNVQEVLLKYRQHESQITKKAALITQSVSMKIRERYWAHAAGLFGISQDGLREVQKLIHVNPATIMSIANTAFNSLFARSSGESRRALIDNINRLYLKAAGNIPGVNRYWLELTPQHTLKNAIEMQIKLRLISSLRVKNGSQFYFILKNIYNKIF